MVFSSLTFIFLFLPLVFIGYFSSPSLRLKNVFLLLTSLIFFAWGGVAYTLLLAISITINYAFGIWISSSLNRRKLITILGLLANIILLGYFKYWNFFIENFNSLNELIGFKSIPHKEIILPIGISFYTFQAMSYLMDVYWKSTPVQKDISKLALYIALFPQLIAGPIVRYHDINKQLANRNHSFNRFYSGLQLFILGLSKKVLIANTLGAKVDQIMSENFVFVDASLAWVGIIFYSLQIYFDFSGYSDMAIGLGRIFGFDFLENFNFPYIAKGIKNFWRRWHISLSSWFRDYLYIPIGGSRKGNILTYRNLLIVFFVTGFWHGASWNFVVWGMIHGLFILIERKWAKLFDKMPAFILHIYTVLVVVIAWVFFRIEDLSDAWLYLKTMFGFGISKVDHALFVHVWDTKLVLIFIIAILASAGFFNWIKRFFEKNTLLYHVSSSILFISGFILCIMHLFANTYNPFIYFRF